MSNIRCFTRTPLCWIAASLTAATVLSVCWARGEQMVAAAAAGPGPLPQAARTARTAAPPRAVEAQAGREVPQFPLAIDVDLAAWQSSPGDAATGVRLCQFHDPLLAGVDCRDGSGCGELPWSAMRPIPWQIFAHGEYVGPHRTVHVPEYRLRPDDQVDFVYRFTAEESGQPYRFGVGDELMIESLTDSTLNKGDLVQARGLQIQLDGTITLPLVGQVPVARRTVEEVRRDLEERFSRFYQDPAITVTPLRTNTTLEGLRATVDGRFGQGGQVRQNTVTPEGTVQLPAIGSAPAQGLTLGELQREIEQRYLEKVGPGVEVTPVLRARAPSFVYVLGEVANPGQYPLVKPTTVMQAITLAGGWNNGGNLRQIVVFRRGEDWRLMATKLDLRGALLGKRPCPADEIWIRDSDIVLIPKTPVLLFDDFINLVFTRGIYGVVPVGVSVNLSKLSTI